MPLSGVALQQAVNLGVTDDAAHMRGHRKQTEHRGTSRKRQHSAELRLRDVPMLALPKKRPLLVDDDGGGGFWICDAVGARDERML